MNVKKHNRKHQCSETVVGLMKLIKKEGLTSTTSVKVIGMRWNMKLTKLYNPNKSTHYEVPPFFELKIHRTRQLDDKIPYIDDEVCCDLLLILITALGTAIAHNYDHDMCNYSARVINPQTDELGEEESITLTLDSYY